MEAIALSSLKKIFNCVILKINKRNRIKSHIIIILKNVFFLKIFNKI